MFRVVQLFASPLNEAPFRRQNVFASRGRASITSAANSVKERKTARGLTTRLPAGDPLAGHTAPVTGAVFAPRPDGRTLLATTSDDRTVRL